ncbi:eCIS core domain-containing protein [Streptomyces sp. NPDC004980]
MSTSHTQETRSDQAGKRRKRKERAATRAPEPKNIVSGAGQPLDLSVRRELEEQLGHDFSRVRLHTDRDAGALTEMLGADAVAVGQDIFFRDGAYRPGTLDGQRLLAHELLHTVQNPHGLGALRAGRDLGAVSLPQQAMEREAESAAQEAVRDGKPAPEIAPNGSTPGWLRYATVDADRLRAERMDPETVVDRLVNGVLRSLRGDPADASGRVRLQLARMPAELQDTVLDALETRLPTPAHDRLVDLVDEVDRAPLPSEASVLLTPHVVPDAIEEITWEQESEAEAWRARLDSADELENERIRQAQRRKAEDPGADSGASEEARDVHADAGGPAPSAPPQAEQGEQESAGAQPLQVEGKSTGAEQGPGAAEDKGAAGGAKEEDRQAEPQQAGTPQPRPAETKRKEASAGQTGAVRPTPVDKSATERDDTRNPARHDTSPESEQDQEDEPSGADEAEALAELEDLVAEAERDAADPVPAPRQDDSGPVDLEGATANASASRSERGMGGGSSPTPRVPADADALAAAIEEGSEDLDTEGALDQQEAMGEPDSDTDGLPGTARDASSGATDPEAEAQERDLAAESQQANASPGEEQGGGDGMPHGDAAPGRLAKAAEDARGQATPSAGGGGSGGSGGSDAPARPASPALPQTAAAPAAAAAPGAGGDTGAVAPAAEVVSAVPRTQAPPKHEPARSDSDKPVTVKAAPRARGGGSPGGGGRGKAAAKPKKAAPAPNVAGSTPEAGLASAAGLQPHLAMTTLKGVNAAVGSSVSGERGSLKGAPPTMERPVGSPRTVRGGPKPSAPGTYTSQSVGKTEAAQGSTPEIKGEKAPSGELPGADMEEPGWWDVGKALLMGLGKKLLSKLLPLDKLTGSIDKVPGTDKGLHGTKVGDAPKLPLKDDSDPERTDKQAKKLDDKGAELHTAGREDAARPMGEDQLYPDVPKETLTARIGGGRRQRGGKGGPADTPGAGLAPEAVSAVAEHEQGPQIKQAFGQARQKMTGARQEKETKAKQDRRQYQQDVRQEVDTNTKEQTNARDRGRTDIARSRTSWRKEQDDRLAEVDGKKGKQFTKARTDIKEKQDKTDQDVDQRTKDDQKKIDDGRTGAEKEATQKRDEGKKDSRNWFEKGLDWIKDQFTKLKKAVKDVFEKARNLVKGVIEEFKKQVFTLIDEARKWVVQQINDFADALIRLGDELLKDYPALRDKWRKSIDGLRDAAVKKVNQVADKLKDIAGKLIDAFGDVLLAGLDLMEQGMLAAVEIAETVTVKAMEVGAALLKGLGEWAAIATDILSDPGGWIGKAKDAAVTGSKEHLFTEIKAAVKEWFNQKVQQLIGIPTEMFNRLVKGGTSKEDMAKMAWDEALPQLPLIIGELIVTKVVAKLIPGAGWVMAIIDALKTAYDALGSILRAFGMFMTFLKAVKSGSGALPFAKAVASGVVALLELIYQWLVSGVGKYLGKVAKALRGKAAKLGKKDSDSDKGPDKRPDPKKDTPRKESPAPQPTRPQKQNRPDPVPTPGRKPDTTPTKSKDERDDDRRRDGRPVNAAGRGPRPKPGKDRPDTKRPGGRGPDTKRPDTKKPDDRRPDLRKPPKDGKRPDKDSPGRKRKAASARKPRKASALSRARNAVRDALAKIRNALRRLGAKARNLLDKLKNLARRLKETSARRRRNGKGDSNRQGDPGGRTDYDLPRVRFRTEDGELHTLLFNGKGRSAQLGVRSTPQAMASFFSYWSKENETLKDADPDRWTTQEQALNAAKGQYRLVEDLQDRMPNSTREDRHKPGTRRYSDPVHVGSSTDPLFKLKIDELKQQMEKLSDLLEERHSAHAVPPLPPTVLPPFADGPRAFDFKSSYIKKRSPAGTEMGERTKPSPEGWSALSLNARSSNWVRMHMLPARLGGHSTTSNLVPARKAENKDVEQVEHPAALAVGKTGKDGRTLGKYTLPPNVRRMVWYDVEITYQASHPGFPKTVTAHWGSYEIENGHWKRGPEIDDWKGAFKPPSAHDLGTSSRRPKVNVNKATAGQIQDATGISEHFAKAIVTIAGTRRITGLADLLSALTSNPTGRSERQIAIDQIKAAAGKLKYTG